MRYRIENRHQDEDWQYNGKSFDDFGDTIREVDRQSRDPIRCGMVRVVDRIYGHVLLTRYAGEGNQSAPATPPPSRCGQCPNCLAPEPCPCLYGNLSRGAPRKTYTGIVRYARSYPYAMTDAEVRARYLPPLPPEKVFLRDGLGGYLR